MPRLLAPFPALAALALMGCTAAPITSLEPSPVGVSGRTINMQTYPAHVMALQARVEALEGEVAQLKAEARP